MAPSLLCYQLVSMRVVKPSMDKPSMDKPSTDKPSKRCEGQRHGVQLVTLRWDSRALFIFNYFYPFLNRSCLSKRSKAERGPWRQRCHP